MTCTANFRFGAFETAVYIGRELPALDEIRGPAAGVLVVCDEHTAFIADSICRGVRTPRCVLPAGENAKNWSSVEAILRAAAGAGLGRDACFAGVGGGVVGDLTGFAASVYMRGCGLCLVPTTLLGMVDASLGGKTGFDLFGVKNLAGAFYPAARVFMPLESLKTLPPAEWKSGMAELIKTAVLSGGDFLEFLESVVSAFPPGSFASGFPPGFAETLFGMDGGVPEQCVRRAVELKGRVVEADPRETGTGRQLLNLGHTFGHALESSAGLGALSHGEAVAWGMARACELGIAEGISPPARAEKIAGILRSFGYETRAPHPRAPGPEAFLKALASDKKKRSGKLTFIVPDSRGARAITPDPGRDMEKIKKILNGTVNI
ncbi:MAG: 3-dehydroquinate synthase [Treponema sp.]|jgi:3-dehydroquinate synthase|nr:3-dehydroquinate synthase [Treponema sp.]